jgi:hypothetical protein
VTGRNHARAPKGANGNCRNRRRPEGARRPAWVRPFIRANRAISSSARLIGTTLLEVSASERHVHRRPVRTSKNLLEASDRLVQASARLYRAARDLARTNECIARDPENAADLPERLLETTESWVYVAEWLGEVAGDVFTFHQDVLDGLKDGTLVPERPADRRPRIVLAPRPVPVRAFLLLRQPRVIDRIASILRRRRRTPRPSAVHVPPDTHQGRAPPLSSICLL